MSIGEQGVSGEAFNAARGISRRNLLRGATVVAGGAVVLAGALGAANAQWARCPRWRQPINRPKRTARNASIVRSSPRPPRASSLMARSAR